MFKEPISRTCRATVHKRRHGLMLFHAPIVALVCLHNHIHIHTNTRRQRIIPGPPLPRHTLESSGPMQRVSGLTSVRDAAPGEVPLVVDLEAKLRHAGILTMR